MPQKRRGLSWGSRGLRRRNAGPQTSFTFQERGLYASAHVAAAAREIGLSPADFLAFFKRERHRLKAFEEAFRQFGWSAMESPVAFLRRINAQD